MRNRLAGSWLVWGMVVLLAGGASAEAQKKARIRRLDGTTLTGAKAATIARRALADQHVTGAEIAVLNGGKVVWTEEFGMRDVGAKLPMGPETVMWGASITKGLFSSYVMTLVDAGFIELDKPVWTYLGKPLPQFDKYKDLAGDVRWRRITARHLLSHTSGLANFAALEPDGKMRLHWEPGTRYGYSGEGMNLLQMVVEKRMGKPLDELMRERIFAPQGMTRTSMVWQESFQGNYALGYDPTGVNLGHSKRMNPRAAGSMDTTVGDLGRFVEGLLAGRVMTAKAQAEMLRPQISITSLHQFPTLANEKGDEGSRVGLSYGLGWGLLSATKYGPAFFKEGHGEGAQNYMICFREKGDCMIVLTNSENGEMAFRTLFEKILGDTVTPWEWEGYTAAGVAESRKNQ
ncbi:serine hydrolase domain-containing protein [Granulicella pectinivorans]|jgi:CubicO group peptidase (beta-lactamase class C family)|nr:serine hydrolase domain-containing protein [Granulicella pectinivorans]